MTRQALVWLSLLVVLGVLAVLGDGSSDDFRSSYRESEHEVVYRETREAKGRSRAASSSECRYKKGPWQDCDGATNTQSRSLTLKRGDSGCDPTKIITKKCKKACRYEKGEWSECGGGGTRTRVDKLKSKSDSACEPTKTINKPCKNAPAVGSNCRYDRNVAWSDCDPGTGKKSKVMRLTDSSSSDCPPTKAMEKNCRKGKGKDKNNDDD